MAIRQKSSTNYSNDALMGKVYLWMFLGLLISGITSFFVISNTSILELIFSSNIIFFGLILAELGLVIYLSGFIQKMSAHTAILAFLLYAFLNGITLSVIFLAYTLGSIVPIFFLAAGIFAGLGLFGYFTKKDLSGWGIFLSAALIGLVILMLINLFIGSAGFDFATGILGIIIFSGLVAYDTQRIKKTILSGNAQGENYKRAAIIGALSLYLDFINLFLSLLRIFGKRR